MYVSISSLCCKSIFCFWLFCFYSVCHSEIFKRLGIKYSDCIHASTLKNGSLSILQLLVWWTNKGITCQLRCKGVCVYTHMCTCVTIYVYNKFERWQESFRIWLFEITFLLILKNIFRNRSIQELCDKRRKALEWKLKMWNSYDLIHCLFHLK